MRKTRSRKPKLRRGRPHIVGPAIPNQTALSLRPSLPPAGVEPAQVPAIDTDRNRCPRCGTLNSITRKECAICELDLRELNAAARPAWWLPPDSKVRRVALLIMAMRLAGMEDTEIAKELGISRNSIGPYVYRAGKNGWLDLSAPRERLEMTLASKAVDNLEEMLNDPTVLEKGQRVVKQEATHRLLEGTIYKQIAEPKQQQQAVQTTVVAIRVEQPPGPPQQIREDTMGGTPAYIEGETNASKS